MINHAAFAQSVLFRVQAGVIKLVDLLQAGFDGFVRLIFPNDDRVGNKSKQSVHSVVKQRKPMLHALETAVFGNAFV